MNRTVTLAGFALLAVAMLVYELVGLIWGRTARLGQTLHMVAGSRWGRWVLLAVWMWLGWHVFVRASWPNGR